MFHLSTRKLTSRNFTFSFHSLALDLFFFALGTFVSRQPTLYQQSFSYSKTSHLVVCAKYIDRFPSLSPRQTHTCGVSWTRAVRRRPRAPRTPWWWTRRVRWSTCCAVRAATLASATSATCTSSTCASTRGAGSSLSRSMRSTRSCRGKGVGACLCAWVLRGRVSGRRKVVFDWRLSLLHELQCLCARETSLQASSWV